MSAYQLTIAPAAKSDLKEIYQYGLHHWSRTQSDKYLDQIKNTLWSLTEQPFIGTERSESVPGIRSLVIESHIIFYRISSKTVEIIRILHGRQDVIRNLK